MIWGRSDQLSVAEKALTSVEACLRDRQFGKLPSVMAGLERALSGLQSGGLDRGAADRLTSLRKRAGRVGDLLAATMAGMRDARSSMTTPGGFSSYDAHGRSDRIGAVQARFERRR